MQMLLEALLIQFEDGNPKNMQTTIFKISKKSLMIDLYYHHQIDN